MVTKMLKGGGNYKSSTTGGLQEGGKNVVGGVEADMEGNHSRRRSDKTKVLITGGDGSKNRSEWSFHNLETHFKEKRSAIAVWTPEWL